MRRAVPAVLILLTFAAPAAAQQKDPLPVFAGDLRFVFARHKTDPSVAQALGVEPGNLPTHSFGLIGGGEVYVLRGKKIALGAGASMLVAGGSKTLDIQETGGTVTKSPTVQRHFRSIVPDISLNFGHRQGWSYVTAGFLGKSRLYVDRKDAPATDVPQRKTLTYGAGAKWFTNTHLAFSVDIRWYSVAEMPAGATVVFEPKTTLMVLSGGIAFK
jgi:hypothetical protein